MISVIDVLTLSQIPNIGINRLRTLVSHFGETAKIFSASPRELHQAEGFSRKLASSTAHAFKSADLQRARQFAHHQLSRVNKTGGRVLTYWDAGYPEQLKCIYDPPPFLFMLGSLEEQDKYALAIVGTRRPSEYGSALAEKFSQEFARLRIVVVSGLARGIDTVAHAAALKHEGRTIAVIGSGIDTIYPCENKSLSQRIADSGAVLSEYAMGAKPDAANFPRRNRIISGLSLGTLVIETDTDGGAMITASMALDQNREVFAVPSNITSRRGRGCNTLIKEGKAKLVETIEDITAELAQKLGPLLQTTRNAPPNLSLFEQKIYDVVSDAPFHIDHIAEQSNFSTSEALVHLLSLEFKGFVRQLPGKMFIRL